MNALPIRKLTLLALAIGFMGCAAPRTLTQAKAEIPRGDLRALEWFFALNIDYWRDHYPSDENKPAERTLKDGFGDCEDFAILGKTIIDTWPGWYSRVVRKRPRHAVLLVVGPDIIAHFDNGQLIKGAPNDTP